MNEEEYKEEIEKLQNTIADLYQIIDALRDTIEVYAQKEGQNSNEEKQNPVLEYGSIYLKSNPLALKSFRKLS